VEERKRTGDKGGDGGTQRGARASGQTPCRCASALQSAPLSLVILSPMCRQQSRGAAVQGMSLMAAATRRGKRQPPPRLAPAHLVVCDRCATSWMDAPAWLMVRGRDVEQGTRSTRIRRRKRRRTPRTTPKMRKRKMLRRRLRTTIVTKRMRRRIRWAPEAATCMAVFFKRTIFLGGGPGMICVDWIQSAGLYGARAPVSFQSHAPCIRKQEPQLSFSLC
jgi:hypothetical protein